MKSLLKLAVGAAIAGALVNMLMKQRSGMRQDDQDEEGAASGDGMSSGLENATRPENAGTSGFTVGELVADTNTVNSGDASRDQRGQQPQEWRGAQNVLDS